MNTSRQRWITSLVSRFFCYSSITPGSPSLPSPSYHASKSLEIIRLCPLSISGESNNCVTPVSKSLLQSPINGRRIMIQPTGERRTKISNEAKLFPVYVRLRRGWSLMRKVRGHKDTNTKKNTDRQKQRLRNKSPSRGRKIKKRNLLTPGQFEPRVPIRIIGLISGGQYKPNPMWQPSQVSESKNDVQTVW